MGRSDLLEKAGRLMLQEVRAQRYQWIQNDGKGYIQLPLLNHPSAFHVFGTRLLAGAHPAGAGPSPKVAAPGRAETSIRCRQVHGDQIFRVTAEGEGSSQAALTGDGLTTDSPDLFIAVSTADCVPVLLFDPVRRAVSAVHAGWRGSCLNISAKAVNAMQLYYGSKSKDLLAGIGPSIGPCCYEVGSDVWREIEKDSPHGKRVVLHRDGGKAMLDLAQLNRLQLIEAGLQPERINDAGLCTSCYPNLFYSFRRDGKKIGNMMSGIMLLSVP